MTTSLEARLEQKLKNLSNLGLKRTLPEVSTQQGRYLEVDGERLLNFSSNDYLGLAASEEVIQKAQADLKRYGLGSGGSRLICGEHPLFNRLETFIANWKQTEAALSFGSGYLTSLGVLRSIITGRDVILYDELSHRCLLEGIKLSSGDSFEFSHNDLGDLEKLLQNHRDDYDGCLVVTEGIFSMDGDHAPVEKMSELLKDYSAWFMVDEAHSAGVIGEDGAGLTVDQDVDVDIAMGTLSKAVAGYGGYVAGSETLRDFLINRATTLIYSTGLPASTIAGSLAALRKIKNNNELRLSLENNVLRLKQEFEERNIPLPNPPSHIIPLLTGSNENTLKAGKILRKNGLYAVPIRPPTVPRNFGRIRFSLRSDHTDNDLMKLIEAVDILDQADLIKRDRIWSF